LGNRRDDISLRVSTVALRHGNGDAARAEAASALAEAGEAGAEILLNGLADSDERVRVASAEGLAQVNWRGIDDGFRDDASVWLKSALQDRDSSIRAAAARSLGRVGGEGAVEALAAVSGDEVEDVRLAVAAALGRLAPNKDRDWEYEPGQAPADFGFEDPGRVAEPTARPVAGTPAAPRGGVARDGALAEGRPRDGAPRDGAPLRMIECPGCRKLAKPEAVRCLRCGSRLRP
jgi:hypothetical protein